MEDDASWGANWMYSHVIPPRIHSYMWGTPQVARSPQYCIELKFAEAVLTCVYMLRCLLRFIQNHMDSSGLADSRECRSCEGMNLAFDFSSNRFIANAKRMITQSCSNFRGRVVA